MCCYDSAAVRNIQIDGAMQPQKLVKQKSGNIHPGMMAGLTKFAYVHMCLGGSEMKRDKSSSSIMAKSVVTPN